MVYNKATKHVYSKGSHIILCYRANPYPADHDYCRFLSVLSVDQGRGPWCSG